MIEVGFLVRDLKAAAARAIEDELDWEHLPYVHASTFSAVDLISADRRGWEADVVLQDGPQLRMRVAIDDDQLGYVNSTFADGIENGRTVCRLEVTGSDSCRMTLRFLVPDAVAEDRAALGKFYIQLFNRLVDEDEPKMIYRSEAIRKGASAHQARRVVTLPDGADYSIPLVCPHQGLPLLGEPDREGFITCPWHGYRFDVQTGACVKGRVKGWRTMPLSESNSGPLGSITAK